MRQKLKSLNIGHRQPNVAKRLRIKQHILTLNRLQGHIFLLIFFNSEKLVAYSKFIISRYIFLYWIYPTSSLIALDSGNRPLTTRRTNKWTRVVLNEIPLLLIRCRLSKSEGRGAGTSYEDTTLVANTTYTNVTIGTGTLIVTNRYEWNVRVVTKLVLNNNSYRL